MMTCDICGYQLSEKPTVNMMSRIDLSGWYNSSYDEDHPNGSVSLHYVIFGGTAGAEDWSPLVILAEQSTISTMSHSNTEE